MAGRALQWLVCSALPSVPSGSRAGGPLHALALSSATVAVTVRSCMRTREVDAGAASRGARRLSQGAAGRSGSQPVDIPGTPLEHGGGEPRIC